MQQMNTLIATTFRKSCSTWAKWLHTKREEMSDWEDFSDLPASCFLRVRYKSWSLENPAIQERPNSIEITAVRQFLDLASYYWQYIHQFSDIAALLIALTQKGAVFVSTSDCAHPFATIKSHLMQVPAHLTYVLTEQRKTFHCKWMWVG